MTFSTEAQASEMLAQTNIRAVFSFGPDTAVVIPAVVIPTTHGHWAITSAAESKRRAKTCSICGESFREFANNAQPVNDGRCCAYCDDHVVIPARIALARRGVNS
jgi:hypothetical protein